MTLSITPANGKLAVHFPFNRLVVDALRAIPGVFWNPTEHAWLVPDRSESASALLEGLYQTGLFTWSETDSSPVSFRSKKPLSSLYQEALETRRYSPRTVKAYLYWFHEFAEFLRRRGEGGTPEAKINAFVTELAVQRDVSASTQNQALAALLFLYRQVLGRDIGDLGDVVRALAKRR